MKTPEEIKKGLECRPETTEGCFASLCSYRDTAFVKEANTLMKNRFTELEADNSRLNDTIRNLTDLLNAAHAETAKAMRERDAACATIKQMVAELDSHACEWCKYNLFDTFETACRECRTHNEGFEWRGVCPENTEVENDD